MYGRDFCELDQKKIRGCTIVQARLCIFFYGWFYGVRMTWHPWTTAEKNRQHWQEKINIKMTSNNKSKVTGQFLTVWNTRMHSITNLNYGFLVLKSHVKSVGGSCVWITHRIEGSEEGGLGALHRNSNGRICVELLGAFTKLIFLLTFLWLWSAPTDN